MIVGTYRLEYQLGEGGMGTVYRATDTKLNRPVAIKFLSIALADASARRRFQREITAAVRLPLHWSKRPRAIREERVDRQQRWICLLCEYGEY